MTTISKLNCPAKIVRRWLCAVAAAALLLSALGCAGCTRSDNRPYEPDTPVPEPHDGVFSSGASRMTFNGDGSTVILELDGGFAARTGLPEGRSEGTYAFIEDLPPHGHVSVRYDTARDLDIYIGTGDDQVMITLDLGYASEDGSSASSYIGMVTETCIPILVSDGGFETIQFTRSNP